MVNHDQKRVKAIGRWEIHNKVAGDLLKWVNGNRVDGSKRGNGGMHIGFVLLASDTTVNILANKSCKTRPLEFGGDQLMSLQVASGVEWPKGPPSQGEHKQRREIRVTEVMRVQDGGCQGEGRA